VFNGVQGDDEQACDDYDEPDDGPYGAPGDDPEPSKTRSWKEKRPRPIKTSSF
jgi:hypothetical protein